MNLISKKLFNRDFSLTFFSSELNKAKEMANNAQGRVIRKKINSLAKRIGLEKPIEIRGSPENGCASACGNAYLSERVGIILHPDFFELSPCEKEFILLHELSHIKNNDQFKSACLLTGIYVIAISIILISQIPQIPAILVLFITTHVIIPVAHVINARVCEKHADLMAFSLCSPMARKASIHMFKKLQKEHLKDRNETNISILENLQRKVCISDKGDYRLDILHPGFSERACYLKEANRKILPHKRFWFAIS